MKYILILLLWFVGTLAFGQDLYKLVYDSMELTTLGPNVTKSTTLKKGQNYKILLLEVPKGHDGYDIVISAKPKVIAPIVVMIDNNPNEAVNGQLVNTYTPGSPTWAHATVTGHYNNTISFSNVANSSLTTKFTGTKVEWIAERKSTHGSAGVSVDGGAETIINLNNPTELKQQVVYTSSTPTAGVHTIKIRVVGGGYVVTDAFRVTQ
jgi:hypothetical protein